MRKIAVLSLLALSASMFAQVQVAENGDVTLGDQQTETKNAKIELHTNGAYEYGFASYISSSKEWGPAVSALAIYNFNRQVALMARANNSTQYESGRAYGVYAEAGNRTSGYNYGVFGLLTGKNNGAGIYGSTVTTVPKINGRYAGYFDGDTYITGTLTASIVTTLSDARYKSNIRTIGSTALIKIAALNPVQYNMMPGNAIAMANTTPSDTAQAVVMNMQNTISTTDNTTHYGLLAQEVKQIYPELVHEDAAGVMSINYIELIPLLIQAVQDLSEQVNALSNSSNVKKLQTRTDVTSASATDYLNILYQNTPNPFTHDTEIAYTITSNAQSATIFVYDMTGVQLSQYNITAFGNGSITINANKLYEGTFLYSLVVDGKLIDTKQMILTR